MVLEMKVIRVSDDHLTTILPEKLGKPWKLLERQAIKKARWLGGFSRFLDLFCGTTLHARIISHVSAR